MLVWLVGQQTRPKSDGREFDPPIIFFEKNVNPGPCFLLSPRFPRRAPGPLPLKIGGPLAPGPPQPAPSYNRVCNLKRAAAVLVINFFFIVGPSCLVSQHWEPVPRLARDLVLIID